MSLRTKRVLFHVNVNINSTKDIRPVGYNLVSVFIPTELLLIYRHLNISTYTVKNAKKNKDLKNCVIINKKR